MSAPLGGAVGHSGEHGTSGSWPIEEGYASSVTTKTHTRQKMRTPVIKHKSGRPQSSAAKMPQDRGVSDLGAATSISNYRQRHVAAIMDPQVKAIRHRVVRQSPP